MAVSHWSSDTCDPVQGLFRHLVETGSTPPSNLIQPTTFPGTDLIGGGPRKHRSRDEEDFMEIFGASRSGLTESNGLTESGDTESGRVLTPWDSSLGAPPIPIPPPPTTKKERGAALDRLDEAAAAAAAASPAVQPTPAPRRGSGTGFSLTSPGSSTTTATPPSTSILDIVSQARSPPSDKSVVQRLSPELRSQLLKAVVAQFASASPSPDGDKPQHRIREMFVKLLEQRVARLHGEKHPADLHQQCVTQGQLLVLNSGRDQADGRIFQQQLQKRIRSSAAQQNESKAHRVKTMQSVLERQSTDRRQIEKLCDQIVPGITAIAEPLKSELALKVKEVASTAAEEYDRQQKVNDILSAAANTTSPAHPFPEAYAEKLNEMLKLPKKGLAKAHPNAINITPIDHALAMNTLNQAARAQTRSSESTTSSKQLNPAAPPFDPSRITISPITESSELPSSARSPPFVLDPIPTPPSMDEDDDELVVEPGAFIIDED